MEECGDKVYSPQRGSTEGEEKEKSREIIRRARRLENSLALFRVCKMFLIENDAGWARRQTEEMKLQEMT